MGAQNFDNCIRTDEWRKYVTNGFISEKEMCDYIESHYNDFARDVLEIEYGNAQREYYFGIGGRTNKPHIDFMFTSKDDKNILVECKNTGEAGGLLNGIGQLLSYIIIAENQGIKISRSCLVLNKYDDRIRAIIDRFNLPIEVFIFSRDYILKVMTYDKN